MYECIICDPDVKQSEVRATGLFYTALSRATTLGDDNGLNSAIYFIGSNITRARIQEVTMKSTKNEEYISVTRRRAWINHLMQNTVIPTSADFDRVHDTFEWTNHRISFHQLNFRIQQYITCKNKP